ncbi:hypothetical protein Clacol_007057 [Clathrus columnatus]|uniref:Uncharacterized protein n=1 Tax=Clathrus columnatus TaxID=1419009 RepID=A0AAV5ADV7_9AGAM|nr:hypothetical protein Clacol_007057 [Clathrus columnatus]
MPAWGEKTLLTSLQKKGHAIPALAYAIRLLQETTHLTITYPISGNLIKQIDDEISQYISDKDPVGKRLRIVPVGEIVEQALIFPTFIGGLFPFCTDIFKSTPYQQANGAVLSPIQKPDICLVDLAFWDFLCLIRNLSPKTPILTLSFANTTSTIYNMGPEELGGRGDVLTKAELLAKGTEKPIQDICIESLFED